MNRVLVTGASGFIGAHLCNELLLRGFTVRAALRAPPAAPLAGMEYTIVGDIGAHTDWRMALEGVNLVVHCAARAHRLGDRDESPYFEINACGTECLVRASAAAGVRRFVLLSSVKVNGDCERDGVPLRVTDAPAPQGAYARSKWAAETCTTATGAATGLETAIVRSPLVYGPGVRGNFLRLLHLVERRLPLPFGCIHNRRSLVSLWNLCDLLSRLLGEAVPPRHTFLVSDGDDLSTRELVCRLGVLLERPARLLPVPMWALRAGGIITGRRAEIARLCDSLRVDAAATCRELSWRAPLSVDEGLRRTVLWYRRRAT